MANIGVCIELFFSDLPYGERIRKIKDLNFKNYEFWFHNKRFDGAVLADEMKNFDEIAELNERYGLTTTDFVYNHPDGGIVAALIDRKDHSLLLDSLEEIIGYANKIGCKRLICGSGNRVSGISTEAAVDNMIEVLSEMAKICEQEGITLLLEPFNSKVDHPDYFLDDPYTSIKVLKAVDSTSARMLFDIYHMQIMSGNITNFIRENIDYIGHFHLAGVPGRNEPMTCELNYRYILNEIYRLGYKGCVGLEYWPIMIPEESLKKNRYYLGE